ncbi:MAG: hypothetical protein JNK60_20645, partial [Acidobacteria bacterium]|nr:hypothetical protein [Acidobacteriota bacterium]
MDPHAGQRSTRTAGFLVLLLTLFVPGLATAQGITVSLDRKVPEPVPPRTRIELVVEPQVPASQGRILVLLGKNDVTDLFEPVGNRYRYRGDLFPLPPGPSEISVSLVGRDGRVTPLGRFTLQVASPAAVTPPPPPPPPAAAEPAPVTEAAPEAPAGAPLTFTLDTGGKAFVPRDAPLLLRASRPLTDADGRLVILIGSMDVSELFARTPAGLSLTKSPVKLPSGSSEVVIFQISDAGESTELSRFPLNVLTSAGLETFELQPRLDLTLAGALDTRDSPEPEVENPRERFQDFTGQLSVQGRLTKQGWTVTSALQATAVSNRQQAIRFGQLGEEAPKVDLASYTVQAQKGATSFTAGTTAFGQDKYLVNQFASRGLVATTGFGGIVDVTGAALSSVNLVGYDNLLGISQRNDRIFAGRLGLELMPKTPGALRVEATYMDGSRTPQDRFQQGVVDDAEENRGVGLRALASLVDGRIRFEGGFARSRFTNPPDPTLNPGGEVVAVQASTKDAYFGVLTADVFRELVLGETARGSVNVVLRHDRVDPLFRSLGATNQADLEQTGLEIN